MKKKLFSLMMMCILAIGAFAQTQSYNEVGYFADTTQTMSYLPAYSLYNYSLTQQIYTVEELGPAGNITSLSFYAPTGTAQKRDVEVYMVLTDQEDFETSGAITVAASNRVFADTITFKIGKWTKLTLTAPFAYDGLHNVAIVVCDKTGDWDSGPSFRVFNEPDPEADSRRAMYVYNDYNQYNPVNPGSLSWNKTKNRNVIRFGGLTQQTVTFPPETANLPINSYYKFGLTQQIYTAEDIDSIGADISGISFYNTGDAQTRDIDIYMVPVDTNAMTTWALDGLDSTEIAAARVFSGEVYFASDNWTEIPIRRFCDYDGSYNLAVLVDDNTDEGLAGMEWLAMYDMVPNSSMYYVSDDSTRMNRFNPDPYDLSGITGVNDSVRPRVRWSFAPKGFVQIGAMSGGFSALPLSATQNYSFSQQIYTPQEIGMSGTIVSIAYCGRPSLMDGLTRNISIYMTETDLEQYAASSDTMIACSASDLVFQGNVSFVAGDWKTIQLTRRFDYDYEKNLLVTVIDNTASSVSSYQYFYYHAAPQMAMYNYNATTPFDITSTNTVGYVSSSNYRSTIQLQFWYDGIDPELDPDIYFLPNGNSVAHIDTLEMGFRPAGAWMRPAEWTLYNKTGNDVYVRDHDFTPNPDFFSLVEPEVPFFLENNDSIDMYFVTDTAYHFDSITAIRRQFVLFYDQIRSAGVWDICVHVYEPVENDVYELATELDVDDLPFLDTLNVYAADSTRLLYDNYALYPDTIDDGNDAVYKLTFDDDALLNVWVYGENAKAALYTEDFYEDVYGIPGPDLFNTYDGPVIGWNNVGPEAYDVVLGDTENPGYWSYTPMYTLYNYSYSQQLYLASELAAAGMNIGDMTQIGFSARANFGQTEHGVKIWMANVDEDEFAEGATGGRMTFLTEDMTLVYDGDLTTVEGWNMINIEEAGFAWDGESNILIAVQRNDGSWHSSTSWHATSTSFTASVLGYSDTAGPYDMENESYESSYGSARANTRFVSGSRSATLAGNNNNNVANNNRNRTEETLTVHDGTGTNGYVPMYGGYFDQYTKSEFVLPAAELADMAGGQITSMKFYISSVSTYGSGWLNSNQVVFIKEVESDQISAYSGMDGATIVFDGLFPTPASTDTELEITFPEPYEYQGGNLLVGVYNTQKGGSGNYRTVNWYGEAVDGSSVAGSSSSSLDGVTCYDRNFLPKTTFTYEAAGGDDPEPEYYAEDNLDFEEGYWPADWTVDGGWFIDDTASVGTTNILAKQGMSAFFLGTNPADTADLVMPETDFVGYSTLTFDYIATGTNKLEVLYGPSMSHLTRLWAPTGSTSWSKVEIDLSELGEDRGSYIIVFRATGGSGVTGLDNVRHLNYGNADLALLDMPVEAGTYYLVVSSTEDSTFMVRIDAEPMPCPEMAYDPVPADDADNLQPRRVDLTWQLGEYTTEYRLVFGSTYYCEEVLVDWTSDLAENYTVYGLYNNTNYFWRVDERNSECETIGEVWGFTTHLNVPENLRLEDESIFVGEPAIVLWDNIDDRTFRNYNIYVDGVYYGSTPTTYNPGQYLTYVVDSLGYNMAGYAIQVSAVYDEGESDLSLPLMVKVSGTGTITGHVYEQDGTTGIAGAEVGFIGLNEFNEIEMYEAVTDANGAYTIAAHASKPNDSISYFGAAVKDGYQSPNYPVEGNPRAVTYNHTTQANFILDEIFYPLAEVIAEYYPDITSDDEYVKVYWSMNVMSQIIEDFETGDFSQYPWELSSSYPWQITTTNPYEGIYCVKSGNTNVASSTSTMQVTVNVPRDGEMSFFAKISSENNWDYGYFYIDGTQMASFTGAGSWVEKVYNVTGGDHTFKWEYTKDGSVNSNDDCFYVDYITFFRASEPLPAGSTYDFENSTMQGWTTIDADGDGFNWEVASNVMSTGYGHNASNDCVLSQSYSNTYGALTPDNYLVSPQTTLGGQLIFYACAQDASYAAEHFGVAVSTTGNTSASAFTTIQEWTMTAKGAGMPCAYTRSGNRAQGNWYQYVVDLSAYAGQTGYVAIRHFNCTDMFYLDVDDITIADAKSCNPTADNRPVMPQMNSNDRAFHHYRIYRTSCYNDGPYNSDNTVLLASDWPTDTVYIDTNFDTVSPGVYKWGVSRVYEGNRSDVYPDPNGRESEIVWSNCLDKDMYLEDDVTVNVLLNSADSPEGTVVYFTNLNPIEQELYPIEPVMLDITGYYAYEYFRKGNYEVTIVNDGYYTITDTVSIWGPEDLRYVMTEIIYQTYTPYVSRTGWAMWMPGAMPGPTPGPTPGPGGVILEEGFEDGLGDWTLVDCNSYTGVSSSTSAVHTGDYGFAFHWSTTPPQYLISPMLNGTSNGVNVSFFYQQNSTYYEETFQVGYSTTTNDISAFTFGAEITAENEWVEYTNSFPAGTKYVAVKCTSDDQYYLYLDDFTFSTGRRDGRHLEGYKVLCESYDHEPIFNENTVYNFCQVATDALVEGEHYYFGVAAIYSTGMSDYTWCEWEYEPCDHYADVDVETEIIPEGNHMMWGAAPGPIPGAGDEFTEGFESGMPAGWTIIDGNNDGLTWCMTSDIPSTWTYYSSLTLDWYRTGSNAICSGSYINGEGALNPNEYLVTPLVNLTNGSTFSFWAAATDASYPADHFGVFVSDNGTSDWTMVNEWTLTAKGSKGGDNRASRDGEGLRLGNWYQYSVDLSAYAGQKYIAIRHFNCTDQYIMCVDDIELSVSAKGGRDMWDLVYSFEGTSGYQYGVATDGVNIYTCSWSASSTSQFYKYDLDGNFISEFNVSGCGQIRDLTFDGDYFYGVANSSTVYCIDLANQTLVNTFTTSYGAMRGITYDPVRDGFWVIGNWSGNLTLIDATGAVQFVGPAPTSASGLAYYADPDGIEHVYYLNNGDNGVYDYNITTGTMGSSAVFNLNTLPGVTGSTGGVFVGTYDDKTCLFADIQQSPQLICILELDENVTPGPGPGPTPLEGVLGYMIFRDGEWMAELPATATDFIDYEGGAHEYLVRVIYDGEAVLPSNNYWYAMSCGTEVIFDGELVCEPGDPINGAYYYLDGDDFGAVISWGTVIEPINEWLYYDDGVNEDAIGLTSGGSFYWGIMIPSNLLQAYAGTSLTKVAYFDYTAHTGNILIFHGGSNAPGTLVHQQTYTANGTGDWIEWDLTAPIPVDETQNLWIVLNNNDGQYVAACGADTGDPNGRWISLDGSDWMDLAAAGLNDTWNLRGFVTNEAKGGELQAIDFEPKGTANAELDHTGKALYGSFNLPSTSNRDAELVAYNVYRSVDLIDWDLVAVVPAEYGVDYYEYYDQVPAGIYYYGVTAVYDNGCESDFAVSYVNPMYDYVVVNVTSVDDNNGKVALYPNPTNGLVKIEAQGMRHITVVSALGQMVFDTEVSADEYEINMAQFTTGVYVVRIATENGVSTQRVTVIK